MTTLSGEVAGRIHDQIQQARSQAAGVEDPSTRRALEALAEATTELVRSLRSTRD